jgi:hypothetical protein
LLSLSSPWLFTPYELVCYIGSLYFKGSVASDFALASGSRGQALTIRLTHSTYFTAFPITAMTAITRDLGD